MKARNRNDQALVTSSQSSGLSLRRTLGLVERSGRDGYGKPTEKEQGVKKLRKISGDKKAVSTILAALLMVVIVVVASVMVYAWSTGLLGALLVKPTTGQEALNMETSAFNANNLNVTLTIRNTGSASVSFTTYYVKDPSGNTYTQPAFTAGPTIQPNQAGVVMIGIGGSCTGCTLSGSAFTFTAGTSYTVTLITSRNGQFVFTAIR